MSVANQQLFTVEEALSRLGQNKEQGCLLVSKDAELIHIFVRDGFVVSASGAAAEGRGAVDHALHLPNASFTWLRGVQPPGSSKNLHLSIREITSGKDGDKPQMIQTNRLAGVEKKGNESQYRYFLVPHDKPTEKIFLTKTSTVMGRDQTSDLVIDNSDVSWRHCILDIQTRGMFILDLDSTNGTYVNGMLVRDAHLEHGDRIELGPCLFTINREAINVR